MTDKSGKQPVRNKDFFSGFILSRSYFAAVFAALTYSFILSNHCNRYALSCIHPYWLDHWLLNYSDGFTRRGLLGTIHGLLIGSTLNLLALNLLCLGIAALILVLCRISLRHLLSDGVASRLVFLAICLSPIASVLLETLGDPLHLLLALFALVCLSSRHLNAALFTALALGFAGISALIHEASIILLWPCLGMLCFRAWSRPSHLHVGQLFRSKTTQASTIIVAIIIGAMSAKMLLSSMSPMPLQAWQPLTGTNFHYSDSQANSFLSLLEGQRESYFSSARSLALFTIKPLRAGIVPALFALTIFHFLPSKNSRKSFCVLYLLICLSSLPLFVIAHDWGRFAAYNLLTTITAFAAVRDTGEDVKDSRVLPLMIISLLSLLYPITDHYRIDGVPLRSFMATVVLVGIIAVVTRLWPWLLPQAQARTHHDL